MDILEWMQQNLHMDGVIVLIVIASGYFQNSYMRNLNLSKDEKTSSALKTLLVAGIVVAGMLFFKRANRDAVWLAFQSYFFATSFYELIVRPITKAIQKHIGSDDN